MGPKQLMVPVELGRNCESHVVMVNRFLYLALESAYVAKGVVRSAGRKLVSFAWDKVDYVRCSFFRGIELLVLDQQKAKSDPATRPSCIPEPFAYLRCLRLDAEGRSPFTLFRSLSDMMGQFVVGGKNRIHLNTDRQGKRASPVRNNLAASHFF